VANKHVSTQFKTNATISGVDSAPTDLMEQEAHVGKGPQMHKIIEFLMDSLRIDSILLREDSVLSPELH